MQVWSKFLLGIGALCLLTVVMGTNLTLQSAARQAAAQQAVLDVAALSSALTAVGTITYERLRWNSALDATGSVTPAQDRMIDAAVADTDAAIAGALSAFKESSIGVDSVRQAAEVLGPLRQAAREAAHQASATRASGAQSRNVAGFNAAARMLDQAALRLEFKLGNISHTLTTQLGLARLSQQLRGVAGERAALLYLTLLATGPLQEHVELITELTGQQALLWNNQLLAIQQLSSPASLANASADIAQGMMGSVETTMLGLIGQLRAGHRPAITPAAFREWVVPTLESSLLIRDLALDDAKRLAASLFVEARLHCLHVIAGASLTVGVLLVTGWFLYARVIAPIQRFTRAVIRVSEANLEGLLPDIDRNDEIGTMSRAVSALRDRAVLGRAAQAAVLDAQATRLVHAERRLLLCAEFETTAGTATQTMSQAAEAVQSTAVGLVDNAVANVRGAGTAEQSVEAAATAVGNVSSKTEELIASISEITAQMEAASTASREILQQSHTADVTVRRLAQSVNRVASVLLLINGIAERTRLLALNATIEAAHAGEAGRGFSVVANEVKMLAHQSTSATAQVSEDINAMHETTMVVVDAFLTISSRVEQLTVATEAIAAATNQQRAATRDVATSVERATSGTQAATYTAREARQRADTAQVEAGHVARTANAMGVAAKQLQIDVVEFLQKVRAA